MEKQVLYKDEATMSLWIGINPRGMYIDLKRVSDGFTFTKARAIGHCINGVPGYYQGSYKNKNSHCDFQHKTIFNQFREPNPAD